MTLRRRAGFALLLAALAPSTRADSTLRYHTDFQTTPLLPAAALNPVLDGMRDMVVQIKGIKARSTQGNLTSILDLKTQDLTMVDAINRRFATLPASQYAEQTKMAMPALPEQARVLFAAMKTNLESRSTGDISSIQGIQAEEHEFIMTIDMAMPGAAPTASPFMKMITQVWTAAPEEAQRVPALQEFKNYTASASFAMNPAEMFQQLAATIPGMGDNLGAMIEEMNKGGGVALRTHMEIVMPFLALMSQQAPQSAGQALPAGADPNAPLMQMTQELVEISNDPLEDAIFQVPSDYQAVSLEEILKGAISAATPPQFKH